MTQAPTPGPLSAHPCYDEHQPGCDCVISEQTASPIPPYLNRLAPTAPVEASGSGSRDEALLNGLHARLLRTAPAQSEAQAFLQRQEALALRAVMDFAIAQARPQPSGETREAGDLGSIAESLKRIADLLDGTTAGICVTETLLGGRRIDQ